MQIRTYTPDDLEAVTAVFTSNIPKYFVAGELSQLTTYLERIDGDYSVGEINGEIVACGGYALNADQTISLCWGMVRSDYIGTGLGKALAKHRLKAAIDSLGNLPVVISTSQLTSGFYKRLGFVMTEHIVDGISAGIEICRMRLDLSRTSDLM